MPVTSVEQVICKKPGEFPEVNLKQRLSLGLEFYLTTDGKVVSGQAILQM